MKNKKLLILGASGGCGTWAVQIAKERGYQVRVLVRASTRYDAPEGVEVIRGEVLDFETLNRAMKGQELVVSCLGIKRKNQANPWSEVVSPTDLAQRSAKNIVKAMSNHQIQRIVAVSAAGVGDSFTKMTPLIKLLIQKSNVRVTFSDFKNMEDILAQSNLDSLAVRPVGLVDKVSNKQPKLIEQFKMTSQISKYDVAKWMMDAIERPNRFTNKTEMIGWN